MLHEKKMYLIKYCIAYKKKHIENEHMISLKLWGGIWIAPNTLIPLSYFFKETNNWIV